MTQPLSEDRQPAPSDTLLGQLQRGRGTGYLRALSEPPATLHPYLIDCITHDPRADDLIEERADYYAQLIIYSGMPLEPLADHLHTSDEIDESKWTTPLMLETLSYLASRRYTYALEILRDYISNGEWWDWALVYLDEQEEAELLEGLGDIICSRFRTAVEIDEASTFGPRYPLWATLGMTHVGFALLLEQWKHLRPSPEGPPDLSERSVPELLALTTPSRVYRRAELVTSNARIEDKEALAGALSSDDPFTWYIALSGLISIGQAEPYYSRLLEQAQSYLQSLPPDSLAANRQRRILTRMLLLLPSELTLPGARHWFSSTNPYLTRVAYDIMKEHATPEDFPFVQSRLTEHLQASPRNVDTYETCSLLDVLARFPGVGPIPEVERVFVEAQYSYARARAALALSVNAPVYFAEHYAFECLYDCEASTRELACSFVPFTQPWAQVRLLALAADPHEQEAVIRAALTRLQTSYK